MSRDPMTAFDFDEDVFMQGPLYHLHVKCDGWDGVAFYVREDNPMSQTIIATMVQDDLRHRLDRDDVHPIDRDEFCGECGQMGCEHDGLEREEA